MNSDIIWRKVWSLPISVFCRFYRDVDSVGILFATAIVTGLLYIVAGAEEKMKRKNYKAKVTP